MRMCTCLYKLNSLYAASLKKIYFDRNSSILY